ncbi:Predicted house-cleaning noncanonical NTP pyrophosphatase, all-alpha NTP-PPase (MazG) superfamily [Planococcus glaciei]|uniref:nucleoside triphosphate pyrophosphohydrolase n=1 Tax=Planococcus glaciei TaxID=459472 RepID=UPI00088B5B54|nr:nucleoside triphosphate pyrophosphohydrolase [Planococcus glaciei]SDG74739.1 Predicted house-cleaning noncanonical NTP pyrophosphatase, all-alpha NTP-PPase (MazG) superfamily [Planococcus glaciei]
MPTYNKLVRDLIPEVIEKTGKELSSRVLEDKEYEIELKKKIAEELTEYNEAKTNEDALEELADILELLHAATKIHGSSFEELEKIRKAKAEKRGGFEKRIFLIEVEDD